MAIITVEHLTKEFRLGEQISLKQTLRGAWARLRRRHYEPRKPFKALDDISLSIEQGEVVGLIGTNGAGKSTLLKIISGITGPTSGRVQVDGRIAPLIEVGAGLHPELTGRENIFLNASILGVPRKIIRDKVDDIAAFAELEDFLDTPIKRYSSGMKVRLGFAIATSVDAEILIVDEVLAVGDLAFQRKCFDRMEDLIRRQHRTVLLVSHNIRQINRLCTRAVLLDAGAILGNDAPDAVCNLFYERSNAKIATHKSLAFSAESRIESTPDLHLQSIALIDELGSPTTTISAGDPLRVDAIVQVTQDILDAEIVLGTHTPDFVYITAHSTFEPFGPIALRPGLVPVGFEISSFSAKPGSYALRLAIFGRGGNCLFTGENLLLFTVGPSIAEVHRPPLRLFDIDARWHLDASTGSSEQQAEGACRPRTCNKLP